MIASGLTIGVVGAGRVGTTLGRRWAMSGHSLLYGVRDPSNPRHEALSGHGVVRSVPEASRADVILLAVPWRAVPGVIDALGAVDESVVVDATNPLASDLRTHDRDPNQSGAEAVATWLDGGRVVKAFNTTGSANMADATYPEARPMMPIAGDDEPAKRTVAGLASEVGFEPIDAGPLAAARDLEHLAALWIRMAYRLGNGPNFAFGVLRRQGPSGGDSRGQ